MEEMSKEDCVNALKHMAAHKFLSLLLIEKHGLKDSTPLYVPSMPLQKEQYVAVEDSQYRALKGAIFHLTGEHFDEDELRRQART